MRRRDFIEAFAGSAIGWPLDARAQQPRMRRIGVLMNVASDDAEGHFRNNAFVQGLQEAGWAVGRNIRIEYRWGAGDTDRIHQYAAELIALAPDVVLAAGTSAVAPLFRLTQSVPIVFVVVPDPVGAGFVESLARPGGNATGFSDFEYGIGAKWLELLKEIAPHVTRVGVLRNPVLADGPAQFAAIQGAASGASIEVIPVNIRDTNDIERGLLAFTHQSNGGLIVTGSALAIVNRALIIGTAARYKFPAIYYQRSFVTDGGLVSYGPDFSDQFRRAAGYVDRILHGDKPADLPVQAPTKYELVINLKTAKALGLSVPQTLLATADEVID
jgi:putative tryptophan/tyrosine transport system substrate-binding protein